MKDWQWIYFRYFVQPNGEGWGVCDSMEYKRVYLNKTEYPNQSIVDYYKVDGEMSLADALEAAIGMNEMLLSTVVIG